MKNKKLQIIIEVMRLFFRGSSMIFISTKGNEMTVHVAKIFMADAPAYLNSAMSIVKQQLALTEAQEQLDQLNKKKGEQIEKI